MATIRQEVGSVNNHMTTELNSIVDSGNAIGSTDIDNSTSLYLYDDLELYTNTMTYAPSPGATIDVYLVQKLDGTNLEDGNASIDPPAANLVGVFNMRSVTTAQRHTLRMIPIPPGKYRYVLINNTGQTLASSGNILKYRSMRYQTV